MDPVAAAIISFAYASVVWYMLLYRLGQIHLKAENEWRREERELLLTIEAFKAQAEPVWYIASEGVDSLTLKNGPYPPD